MLGSECEWALVIRTMGWVQVLRPKNITILEREKLATESSTGNSWYWQDILPKQWACPESKIFHSGMDSTEHWCDFQLPWLSIGPSLGKHHRAGMV